MLCPWRQNHERTEMIECLELEGFLGPLDLPASERFLRQLPSLLRARGCAPPLLGTWGIPLPALRSAMRKTSNDNLSLA